MYDELTQVDIDKMREEIEERIALRKSLKEAVKAARELGDLSENDEYRSAKREMGKNNSRIRYLESMIRTAVIITVSSEDGVVGLFDEVTISYPDDIDAGTDAGENSDENDGNGNGDENGDEERTIRIVTTLRNDVFNDCISKESPVGRALLGKRVGERVTVRVNDNVSYPVIIKKIVKGTDDSDLPIAKY